MFAKVFKLLILNLILLVYPCKGVIYKLNESEYERMPPLWHVDEHDVCLSRDRGLYCMLRLQLFDDGENPLMKMIHEYSDNYVKHYNHSIIERGVCVQDTCANYNSSLRGEELKRALGACLNESIWQEYGVQANVSELLYCDSHGETEDITTLDWTVMAVFIVIVMVNLIASVYDYIINYYSQKDIGNKYILSFSMIRNFDWLVSAQPENPKTQVLQFIHCIRVITNFLMILAHAIMIIAVGFTMNPHEFEKTYETVFYQLIYNGMMIVQIFFCMSGFLLAYNFQLYAEKVKITWLSVPTVMILRCCRLSPALAVVLAFTATWLRHLGSGPLWKLFITNSVVADCRTYWWYHLLYINNYMQGDKYCAIPTWHIAADSQVYLVGLIACVATAHRGRRLMLGFLLLVGTLVPALQVWLQDLDGVVLLTPEFYRTMENQTFRRAHVGGHTNLQSFVLGMLLAYLVYDCQEKGVDLTKNKYYSLVFWLSPPAIALWFYSGVPFYADGARASLAVRMAYAASHRLVMAGIAGLFGLGMVLRAPSFIRNITEWRVWMVPSRLSYSVYLLHMNLVHILMAHKPQLGFVSFYEVAIAHFGIVLFTYLIAVPFFLMVEAPCNRLVKVLLDPFKPIGLVERKSKESTMAPISQTVFKTSL